MINKKRIGLSVVLAILAGGVSGAPAEAGTDLLNGVACNPSSGSVSYNAFGANNPSTSSSTTLWCSPTHDNAAPAISSLIVGVYDRHSSQNVCCKWTATDITGTPNWSSSQVCSFQSDFNLLVVNPPSGTDGILSLSCTLPPKTSAGLSHLTSVFVGH